MVEIYSNHNILYTESIHPGIWVKEGFQMPDIFTSNIIEIVAWDIKDMSNPKIDKLKIWITDSSYITIQEIVDLKDSFSEDKNIEGKKYGVTFQLADYPLILDGVDVYLIYENYFLCFNIDDSYIFYKVNEQYNYLFNNLLT